MENKTKIAIALKEDLGPGFMANAAACIASGLFHEAEDVIGPEIEGDGCMFIPITKIPLLILKQNNKGWDELLKRAKRNKLKYMVFTREAQSTVNYEEYVERVKGKNINDLDVIGFGVFGEENSVNKFSGDLPLLK